MSLAPATPEFAREQATAELDALIARIAALLGPTAMAALVAGRVARAAQLNLQRPYAAKGNA